jgi:hypothetical protein
VALQLLFGKVLLDWTAKTPVSIFQYSLFANVIGDFVLVLALWQWCRIWDMTFGMIVAKFQISNSAAIGHLRDLSAGVCLPD